MGQKITVTRGRSATIIINVPDANGGGYTLESGEKLLFGVKETALNEELLIQKTITECTDGVATLKLIPEDTVNLKFGRYIYDVSLESGSDLFDVVTTDAFVIKPNVTKWGDGS